MLYRRNEKGCYEGVTDRGEVVQFEDAAEMVASAEIRWGLNDMLGGIESIEIDDSVKEIFEKKEKPATNESGCKKVNIRIHKGEYTVSGNKLIKKALA